MGVEARMIVKRNARATWDRSLIEGVLANVTLFRGATPAQIGALAAQCWTMGARRGEAFVAKGTRLPGAFTIAHGSAKLCVRGHNGDEKVVRFLRAGQPFGLANALLGRPAAFEASAVSDCKLVVVPAAAVFALLEADPRRARQAMLVLAERNLDLLAELEAVTLRNGAQRLASYVRSLADRTPNGATYTVRLPASKTLVASRLDMKKETLSRLLRALSGQGMIRVAGGEITVLDEASLARLAVEAAETAAA